jgi:hypothetical protein
MYYGERPASHGLKDTQRDMNAARLGKETNLTVGNKVASLS